MKTKVAILLTAFSLALASCGSSSETPSQVEANQTSSLQREYNPQVTTTELSTLAQNNNAFAFDLFEQLHSTEGDSNIFFSPYSISQALVMTYAGANGETKTQMAQALHFEQEDNILHSAFNALDLSLNSDDGNYTLDVANSLWVEQNFTIKMNYLDTIMLNYGAGLHLVDFINETEATRVAINRWVEQKTRDRIQELIPKNMISPYTRLVLVNAIYFKASWINKFYADATTNEDFTLTDNSIKSTPTMHQTDHFNYSETDRYQAIELLYTTYKSSMLIILPKEGNFKTVLSTLSSSYDESIGALSLTKVALSLPKFEFTTKLYPLSQMLQSLGMIDAFSEIADFSGITDETLFISEVLHKAFIKVDENGSEAAAATAIVMETTGIGLEEEIIDMDISRPFIFFIQDRNTHQILFMGLVNEPINE